MMIPGTPFIVGDRLFVMGAGRTARCFDIKRKKQVWETRLPGEFRDEFLQSSFLVTPEVAAVVCGAPLRSHLSRLLERTVPNLPLLSREEIPPRIPILLRLHTPAIACSRVDSWRAACAT